MGPFKVHFKVHFFWKYHFTHLTLKFFEKVTFKVHFKVHFFGKSPYFHLTLAIFSKKCTFLKHFPFFPRSRHFWRFSKTDYDLKGLIFYKCVQEQGLKNLHAPRTRCEVGALEPLQALNAPLWSRSGPTRDFQLTHFKTNHLRTNQKI
jgi:hypothetical protein